MIAIKQAATLDGQHLVALRACELLGRALAVEPAKRPLSTDKADPI